jgi:hypothetical protein
MPPEARLRGCIDLPSTTEAKLPTTTAVFKLKRASLRTRRASLEARRASLQVRPSSPFMRRASLQVRPSSPSMRRASLQVRPSSPFMRRASLQVRRPADQVRSLEYGVTPFKHDRTPPTPTARRSSAPGSRFRLVLKNLTSSGEKPRRRLASETNLLCQATLQPRPIISGWALDICLSRSRGTGGADTSASAVSFAESFGLKFMAGCPLVLCTFAAPQLVSVQRMSAASRTAGVLPW